MSKIREKINFLISLLCVLSVFIMSFIALFSPIVKLRNINIIIFFVINLILISLVVSYLKKDLKTFKICYISSILFLIFYILYVIIIKTKLYSKITSFEALKDLIKNTGARGIFTYLGITILQVVILPIPSSITILAGTAIYGPALSFIISTIGIVLGSILAFIAGKTFGKKLIYFMFGKDNVDKYMHILDKRSTLILFVMFMLPFFPDDLLCMIAGLTNMRYKTFVIITIISRAIGIGTLSFFGSGSLIPFSGWGIYAWIIIAVTFVTALIFYLSKRKKINSFFYTKFLKNK